MPETNINGSDIYYEVHGEGEPLVMLHHGMGSMKMWDKLLPGFSAGYKTIIYDRWGFGRSGKENFRDFYRSDSYTSGSVDELSILLEYLDIDEKVYILGQCEAGVIGFHYAARYPEKVKAIAISSTMCCSKTEKPRPSQTPENRTPPTFETADPDFREKLIYWHGESWAPEFFSLFNEGGGAYGTGNGFESFDLRYILGEVRCPSLVLYPDRSSLFDVEQAVMIYRALPEGELAVLPRCGHNTYEHQPEEYTRIILSFFARHR